MPKKITSRLALLTTLPFLALSAPVQAQSVLGSGVPASTVPSSAERPIGFAQTAPADAGLLILMEGTELPASASLSSAERTAVEAAIASADFKGKKGNSLKLRGIGSRPFIMLSGAAKSDDKPADWKSAAGSAIQKSDGGRCRTGRGWRAGCGGHGRCRAWA